MNKQLPSYHASYNNTSLANDYCYNEQLVGGEDLDPFVVIVTNIYVTIRTDGLVYISAIETVVN